jgi:hypothetical protein
MLIRRVEEVAGAEEATMNWMKKKMTMKMMMNPTWLHSLSIFHRRYAATELRSMRAAQAAQSCQMNLAPCCGWKE